MVTAEFGAFDVIEPHHVRDPSYVKPLAAAYARGANVNPIVVLTRYGWVPIALSGSHRLAAMRKVFGNEQIPRKYVISLDAQSAPIVADAYRFIYSSQAGGQDLDVSRRREWWEWNDVVAALAKSRRVPGEARRALKDQF